MCSDSIYINDKCIHIVSKDKSKEIGMTTYFTGLPCPRGHVTERYSSNYGCIECLRDDTKEKSETNKKNTLKRRENDFISRSNDIHRNFYDYSEVVYQKAKSKVKIICPMHGEFYQRPDHHLHGRGCPSCKSESHVGSYTLLLEEDILNSDATLYHVRISYGSSTFDKIGITRKSVKSRFRNAKHNGIDVMIINQMNTSLRNAIELESHLMEILENKGRRYKVHDLKNSTIGGWTECFLCEDLDPSPYFA